MPEEVRHDVLNALKHGKPQKYEFIRDWILTNTVPFFDHLKMNKCKIIVFTAPEDKLLVLDQKVMQS